MSEMRTLMQISTEVGHYMVTVIVAENFSFRSSGRTIG